MPALDYLGRPPATVSTGPKVAISTVNGSAYNGTSATLQAGDNIIVFASTVYHVAISNNTNAAIGVESDEAASAGSFSLGAGQPATLDWEIQTALHLFVSGTPVLNGTSTGNIYLKGRA